MSKRRKTSSLVKIPGAGRGGVVPPAEHRFAAGQSGTHPGGRRTWGHSMIVDPWGEILAERQAEGEGLVLAAIDCEQQARIRASFPSLNHRRL